jgi:hypothetical protein
MTQNAKTRKRGTAKTPKIMSTTNEECIFSLSLSLYVCVSLLLVITDRLDKRHGQALVSIDVQVDSVNGIAAGNSSGCRDGRDRDRGRPRHGHFVALTLKG